MNITLGKVFLALFFILSLGDAITTLIIKYKHPVFNEASPLFIIGVPIWALIILKLALVIYLIFIFRNWYAGIKYVLGRYVLVYFLVIITLLNLGVIMINISVINTPSDQIQPIPDEIKLQVYQEQIGDLKALENITPYQKGFKVPLIITLFILNAVQFITWRSFEKHGRSR